MARMLANIVAGDAWRSRGWGYRCCLPRGRLPFDLRLSCNCLLHKILNFLSRVDLKHNIKNLLGSPLGPGGLVNLMGFELRQDIAKMVYPLLI